MAKNNQKLSQYDPIEGAAFLRQVFPLLARLAPSGTERDKAKNRQLLFSQYAGLILVGLLNPILNSARSLIASSGLKNIRRLTGGKKTSLGSFSEAASVFDPALLEGIIKELRTQWHKKRSLQQLTANGHLGKVPENIVERLVAVDGSVLTALPQLIG
jgi:hypothetical protein